MAYIEQDIAKLNIQFLMLMRECAANSPFEATWRFGLNTETLEIVKNLSLDDISELSSSGVALISIIPSKTPDHTSIGVHAILSKK